MRPLRSAAWYFGKVVLLALSIIVASSLRGQSVQSDPVQAVRAWYTVFDDASGAKGQYSGFVGNGSGPFPKAYQLLSPMLQARMSELTFEESYAQVAHMELLQANLARLDQKAGEADVFVEEERTVVLDRIPAVAWYEGTLHLTETSGARHIAEIALTPEDIISMTYGGHQPWLGDPLEVAKYASGQSQTNNSNSGQPCSSAVPQPRSGILEVDICGNRRYRVRMVKLHSGEWRVISTDPPPTSASN
jgi:hypothetical protein